MRFIAMLLGLVGAVIALIINVLTSFTHAIAAASGAQVSQSHGFYGLALFAVALVGSFLALPRPRTASAFLLVAGVGFYFVLGWWTLLASPFLLLAAVLAFLDRTNAAKKA
jgi:hypothetical protein